LRPREPQHELPATRLAPSHKTIFSYTRFVTKLLLLVAEQDQPDAICAISVVLTIGENAGCETDLSTFGVAPDVLHAIARAVGGLFATSLSTHC
jgi:hypothetical protein